MNASEMLRLCCNGVRWSEFGDAGVTAGNPAEHVYFLGVG